jgi:hypothetical protein
MTSQTDRETRDILRMIDDKHHYYALPEHRKTAAVSLAAVSLRAKNLEYVPETVLSRDFEGRFICRTALQAKDADCTILPYIPFPGVQKEAIQQFSADTPAFILYSFADISNLQMANDAVKGDAYCIQLVPDNLLNKDLCKMAQQSPNYDEKMEKFIMERFPELNGKDEKKAQKAGVKMKC